jgi:hypothetical protein
MVDYTLCDNAGVSPQCISCKRNPKGKYVTNYQSWFVPDVEIVDGESDCNDCWFEGDK